MFKKMLKQKLLEAEDIPVKLNQSVDYSQKEKHTAARPSRIKQLTCWQRFKDDMTGRFNRTFFRQFDKYFDHDYEKACINSMNDNVLHDRRPLNAFRYFEKSCRDINESNIKGSKEDIKNKIHELTMSLDRPLPLIKIIIRTCKDKLLWSIFFKILQQITTLTIPLIMTGFIDDITKYHDSRNTWKVLGKCFLVAFLTFWIEVWSHLSIFFASHAKTRAIEGIKSTFFQGLLEANIEFHAMADTSYISKMLVHELKPISLFMRSSVNFLAGVVSIPYALVLVVAKLKFNRWMIISYLVVVISLLIILHRLSKHFKRKFSSFGGIISGQVEEFTANARFIKANSLQSIGLRGIWSAKRSQMSTFWIIKIIQRIFDMLFETPVLVIFIMIILYLRSTSEENSINESSLYGIVGLTEGIKQIMMSIGESIVHYQNFKPSINLYQIFFNFVSRSPRFCIESIKNKKGGPDVSIQVPEEDKHKKQTMKSFSTDLAIKFEGALFYDKTMQAIKVLSKVFKESKGSFDYERGDFIDRVPGLALDNLQIPLKNKVCVMGRIDQAKGQRFFFECLSNEHELSTGKLFIRGKVSHFDLTKFELFDESFIENIVLDAKLNYRRFFEICRVIDLNLSTMNGGRYGTRLTNSNMSDIDRIKILLARSLYHEFDIFVISTLFDKLPYDTRLALFDSLVIGYLKDSTVVYHSNDRELAEKADLVIVFRDGKIVQTGTSQQLGARGDSAYRDVIAGRVRDRDKMKTIFTDEAVLATRETEAAKKMWQLGVIFDEKLEKIRTFQDSAKSDRFFRTSLILLTIHRKIKNVVSKRKKFDISKTKNELLNQSTYSSFMRFVKIDGFLTPWKIGFIFILYGLLLMIQNIWIGWWGINFFKLNNDRPYVNILIILKSLSIIFLLVKDLTVDSTTISISTTVFLTTLKKLAKSSIRWIELMSTQLINYNVSSYQHQVDFELNDLIFAVMKSFMIIGIGMLTASVFYPGVFLVVTIFAVWYVYSVIKKAIRSQRIVLDVNLRALMSYYIYVNQGRKHAVSMRYIGQQGYLFNKMDQRQAVSRIYLHT